MSERLRVLHGTMILTATLIASSFPVSEAIATALAPQVITFLRFAVAAVAILLVILVGRTLLDWPTPGEWLRYAACSAPVTFFFVIMMSSLQSTSALHTGVLYTLVPGLSAVYAYFLVGEKIGPHRVAALGVCTLGAVWVIFRGDVGRMLTLEMNAGDALFLAGCLVMGLYAPFLRRFNTGKPARVVTFWILVTGVIWLLPVSFGPMLATDWARVDAGVIASVVYLALFVTGLTFFLYQFCTQRLGPTRVVAYSFATPVLVVGIDLLFGKPLPPLIVWPGIVIVLAAIAVVQTGARPPPVATAGKPAAKHKR
ncbi:MAG: DMT family transporter [Alphaproteobacteria bacterium]